MYDDWIWKLFFYVDWLLQERRNSIVNARELRHSCTNASCEINIGLALYNTCTFRRDT